MNDVNNEDEYKMIYLPQHGTQLYFNEDYKTTIIEEDFAYAYFGIWLSEYPLDRGLKKKPLKEL